MKLSLFLVWTCNLRDHASLCYACMQFRHNWQVSAVTLHSTRQREVCKLHTYCSLVSSVQTILLSSLISTQHAHPQPLSLGTGAGLLHPLGGDGMASAPTLSDRFQLGGPMNLWMF